MSFQRLMQSFLDEEGMAVFCRFLFLKCKPDESQWHRPVFPETGTGFSLDLQFRAVNDNGLAFMGDLDAGGINYGDDIEIVADVLFGVGKCIASDAKMMCIVSGVIGANALQEESEEKSYNEEMSKTIERTNFVVGADIFFRVKSSWLPQNLV